MKKRTGILPIVICGAILLLLLSARAGAQPQPAAPPPQSPEAVKVGENLYRLGQVMVDTQKREVTLRGWINMEEGLVEYLAVAAGGKLHESVLVLDARPTHLQVALILLGLEAKGDFEFQGDLRTPKGDPVEIWVEWKEKEQTKRVRAERLIRDMKRNQAMEATPWIFTGSKVYEGVFLAEIAKSLIATYHDPAAVLNNPLPGGGDDTVYHVNSEVVPKKGTAVVLTIKPLRGDKGKRSDPSPKEEMGSFFDPFEGDGLDSQAWKITREGDFRGSTIDTHDHRLRLRADTEGWPERREGRPIAHQQIELALDGQRLEVWENGQKVYDLSPHGLTFSSDYLYLQMSSHSNYPPREVYFDNVEVKPAPLSDEG